MILQVGFFTVRSYLSFSSILILDWTAEDLSILGAMS